MARLDRRAVAERLGAVCDATEVGNIIGDACERGVPHGIFNFVVVGPGVTNQPCMIVRSNRFSPEWGLRRFPEMLVAMEKELGGVNAVLGERRAFDAFQKFPIEKLRNTELLNDHFRPVGSDQQLIAPVWHGGAPVGYFAVARSRREIGFVANDLRFVEEMRVMAERGLGGVTTMGAGDLPRTLDALSQVFPYPAFLFDSTGRLRWMSDEGMVRLDVTAARVGVSRLIRGNAALDGLSRCAGALSADPAIHPDARLRLEGILRPSERLAVRRFEEHGVTLLLLAFTPAVTGLAGEARAQAAPAIPRLGIVESRVARLAIEGFTVLNIATRLGVSESTVRTHLRRVYVKLGVHGRAELASVLLRGHE